MGNLSLDDSMCRLEFEFYVQVVNLGNDNVWNTSGGKSLQESSDYNKQ